MPFEFDPAKDVANRRKHGVALALGLRVFDGDYLEAEDRRFPYGEVRMVAVGPIRAGDDKLYSVTYTWRGNRRRLISVRRASEAEAQRYRDRNA
jgi:hypothetical protein